MRNLSSLARLLVHLLGTGLLIATSGCTNEEGEAPTGKEPHAIQRAAAKTHSGYDPNASRWGEFLECWRKQVDQRLRAGNSYFGLGSLPPNVNLLSRAADSDDISSKILASEKKLGLSLPKSYKDFVVATGNSGWYVEALYGVNSGPTLLPVSQIDFYAKADPKSFETWRSAGDSDRALEPERYLRYGFHVDPSQRQDTSYFKSSQLGSMILVGKYDQGGAVLLNSNVVTSDGEFEAWTLDFRTHVRRYRSFAELLKDLVYIDVMLDKAESTLAVEGAQSAVPCTSKIASTLAR